MYTEISDLPEYIRKFLPLPLQQYFLEVFTSAHKNFDENTSFEIAWQLTKTKLVKTGNTYIVNNNFAEKEEDDDSEDLMLTGQSEEFKDVELHSFMMNEPAIKVVMNSDTEEIVMEAILATTDFNTEGKFFAEEDLAKIAEQINSYGSTLPDIDHEKLISIVKKHGNDYDAIMKELKNEKGVFKNIKAVVNKGSLWIQAVLDKRYKNVVKKFTGLSIEAVAESDKVTGRLRNPKYLGFTLTNNPKLKNARIAA